MPSLLTQIRGRCTRIVELTKPIAKMPQFTPAERLAEVRTVLLSFVKHGGERANLEGRGDITSFLSALRDVADSLDQESLKRPWWMDDAAE